MRLVAAFLALASALAASAPVSADEITLNNGNVLEGEIVKETPGEVVIKTEFGEMKVRRAQIKSIRRVTLPSAGTKPAEPPAPAADPNSVLVPGTGIRLPAFPAEWAPAPGAGENALGFVKAPGRSIVVRALPREENRGADLDALVRLVLGGNPPLREAAFRHGGFEARRVLFRSPKSPGAMLELYAIDAGTSLAYAQLHCPEAAFDAEDAFFWRQVEGLRLRVPAPAGGERDRAEMTLGSPGSQAAFLGPEGPWMHVQDEMNPVQPMAAFSQGGSRACVVFTMPWDGGGEMLRENYAAFLGRFGPVAGAGEVRNAKPYAASGRFELSGDFRTKARDGASWTGRVRFVHRGGRLAGALGIAREDEPDRRDGLIGRFLDSLDARWDVSKALEPSRWREVRPPDGGCRLRVPRDWQDARGYWVSPGGSFLVVQTGPKENYAVNPKAVGAFLRRFFQRDFAGFEVLGEGEGALGRGTARTMTMKVVDRYDNRFDWPADLVLYHGTEGDRFYLVFVGSPSPGLETQEKVFRRMLDSFELQ